MGYNSEQDYANSIYDSMAKCGQRLAAEQKDREKMTGKDQILKMLDGRIDTMGAMVTECIELIYNAGYNEAIEAAIELARVYKRGQSTDMEILHHKLMELKK